MPSVKARIKDIAMLAGVSIGTVDRVLHNRGEVAEKTKQRVRNIIMETNYSPNVMAQALKSSKKFHIISLLPEPADGNSYWLKHPSGMKRALEELEPFPINVTQLNFDIQSEDDFLKKTEMIPGMSPDAILLAPIFKKESLTFCRKLNKRKIPFIFIDGYIEEASFLAYIGEDVRQSGKVAGQLADLVTDIEKDVLVINIARNIQNVIHLELRTNGFLSYFKESGRNKGRKIGLNISEPSESTVKKSMDDVLRKNPDIGAVFISGSKSYLIADYLNKKKLRSINLIGYDLLDENVRFLKSGSIRFLIGQRPEEQTYKAIKKLFDYLSVNRVPEKYEFLPVDIVTSENVDYFV